MLSDTPSSDTYLHFLSEEGDTKPPFHVSHSSASRCGGRGGNLFSFFLLLFIPVKIKISGVHYKVDIWRRCSRRCSLEDKWTAAPLLAVRWRFPPWPFPEWPCCFFFLSFFNAFTHCVCVGWHVPITRGSLPLAPRGYWSKKDQRSVEIGKKLHFYIYINKVFFHQNRRKGAGINICTARRSEMIHGLTLLIQYTHIMQYEGKCNWVWKILNFPIPEQTSAPPPADTRPQYALPVITWVTGSSQGPRAPRPPTLHHTLWRGYYYTA